MSWKTGMVWMGMLLVSMGLVAEGKEMSVQVRTGQLRARPSFLGALVAEVSYGDRVRTGPKQGAWIEVTVGEATGWMHESALTKSRIRLTAGETEAAGAASSEELALAGKGFNADVEAEFKVQHADVDFSWVDRMEGMGLTPERLARFLKAGGVVPVEGGRE